MRWRRVRILLLCYLSAIRSRWFETKYLHSACHEYKHNTNLLSSGKSQRSNRNDGNHEKRDTDNQPWYRRNGRKVQHSAFPRIYLVRTSNDQAVDTYARMNNGDACQTRPTGYANPSNRAKDVEVEDEKR
ncbi:hypothetical protein K504DRAFT_158830 [Pleomassaria siparia CBS 279.74]|uniref:Secreted protein n=1 Tax=Pleomassaria siparia CBS 279.74 TaxID=1314801 RepID=A0A6G1JV32_9PLEO|nr:hypothetical protein K504DRAFT_158830 [Pleomassaria siparia CBS 279.74]